MLLARENGGIKFFAETYRLEFAKDRPFVYLDDQNGVRIVDLFVLSSVHPLTGRDDTTDISAWSVDENLDEVVFTLEASSSVWQKKIYRFRCRSRRFRYEVEVRGAGQLAEAHYLGGYYSAQIRWGSGFFLSGQNFQQGFNPEPSCAEVYTFPSQANSTINLSGVPLPGKDDWFLTPPPFCFAFETQSGWLGIGVEAQPGKNQYTEYQYHGSPSAFYLTLPYEGYTQVNGSYELPALAFDFGPDPYTLLAAHVHHLRAAGLAPVPNPDFRPNWWTEPIFCGWGAQNHLSYQQKDPAPAYATQANYEHFLQMLENQGIHPGTIVLDDKWQATYGENEADQQKWPDLPGFIRDCHNRGQHVLLWLKAWAPEGLPVEECILNAAGLPAAVDPTNPVYERHLRATVRRMLSPEGYDADGFKIDFSARIPNGPGMQLQGSSWGLELMRLYLSIIRDEARQVKPDAFIITHTPHPYLADLMDAVRLNDINTGQNLLRQMTHRARIAAIACPEALIDTDNWPIRDKAAWREYLALKPTLGIPALYFASHIDATGEAFNDADYALLRETWAAYRAELTEHQRHPSAAKINELGGAFLPGPNRSAKRLALSSTLSVETKPLKTRDNKTVLHGQA